MKRLPSKAVGEADSTNPTPLLPCRKCRSITAHEFSHLELHWEFEPKDPPAVDLIYRCDTCNAPRRWGVITWAKALELDPSLSQKLNSV